MALIDEIKIYIKAGSGGDGVVRFRHEKGKEYSGPSGGNGGRGGDVFIRAVSDISLLSNYKHVKKFEAEKGEDGFKNSCHGKNGENLYIDFPVGSILKNQETGEKFSLEKIGQEELILKGGRGGLGNEYFKSSTNQTPEESTKGQEGESAWFQVELQMFAQVGLVGLPNAGKSSLLNALTNANSKIGSYQFTTLEPHLGALYEFVLADIPGLIEGASEGKGLGHKFLKHIKRTEIILHLVSAENENVREVYETVAGELEKFDETLLKKRQIILLTKTDVCDEKTLKAKIKELKATKKEVMTISVLDDESVKNFKDSLVKLLREEEGK